MTRHPCTHLSPPIRCPASPLLYLLPVFSHRYRQDQSQQYIIRNIQIPGSSSNSNSSRDRRNNNNNHHQSARSIGVRLGEFAQA